jgi:hypothetical protein
VAVALLWFFVWKPQAKEARAEKEQREAECEALLKSIRYDAPDFILKARLEFERDYRSKGGEDMLGQEMSPLLCLLLIFCNFASLTHHLEEVTSRQMGPAAGRCPAPPLFNSSGARLFLSQRRIMLAHSVHLIEL